MKEKTERSKTFLLLTLIMFSSVPIAENLKFVVASDHEQLEIDDFDDDTYMYRDVLDANPDGDVYMLYSYHGGTWCDAEKTADNTDDDLLCWAAAASNVLEWTGWGVISGMTNTDQMFAHYQNHWTDLGGRTDFGWNWWFDGTNPAAGWPGWAQVDVPGGGDFWTPPYTYSDYYHEHEPDDTALQAIDDYMHAGWGTALSIAGGGGHAITCWGYTYNPAYNKYTQPHLYYTGIYITDSDDDKVYNSWDPPPNSLRYYTIQYKADNKWHLLNYYSTDAWYIRRVMALEPKPSQPEFMYHFKASPFSNVFHVNIDASGWINGYMTGGPTGWNPVLGKVQGSRVCIAIDVYPDETPGYYETMFLIGKATTMTGQLIQTHDGMSYYGPHGVNIVFVSGSEEAEGPDLTEASGGEVAPDAWYKFRLSPYTDIININENPGGWLNGYDDLPPVHHPVLGFYEGDRWYFGIDGLDSPYTLAFNTGRFSTLSGEMIRTEDGIAFDGPISVWVTWVSSEGEPLEGESALLP